MIKSYFNADGEPTGIAPEDAIAALLQAIANNLYSKEAVIQGLGIEAVGDNEKANAISAEAYAQVKELLGLPPEASKDEVLAAIQGYEEAAIAEESNALCPEGKTLKNGKENSAWLYANAKIKAADRKNRKEVVEKLKTDPAFIDLKRVNAQGVPLVVENSVSASKSIWG